MERLLNYTSSATTPATATVASAGGVEVVGKVYRGDGIDINDFPHLRRHETPEVRNCREIVTGRIVTEFELREG